MFKFMCSSPGVQSKYHRPLLCRNEEGYRNLSYMVSKAYLEGFYIKPRIDMDLLREHAAGLIACSACLGGSSRVLPVWMHMRMSWDSASSRRR